MSMQKTYLTLEGYEKLRDKLKYLRTVRRGELSKEIGIARKHGDLKENSEYDAAKNAQGLNEAKIAELEGKLSNGRIIDYEDIPSDRVLIGAIVKLKDLDSGEKIQYTLVSELEADFAEGKISVSSPVAQSLLGHKENEIVEINVPAGILRYKIIKISR